MATYLIDYENVHIKGMNGVESLGEKDSVMIFYSERSNTLTFSLHERINASRAAVQLISVTAGSKNSLDFQLVTYLGWLIAKRGGESYVIVSRDQGFQSVVSFWKERGIRIKCAYDLSEYDRESYEERVGKLIPQYRGDVPLVIDYLEKYKTKQGFNNALAKQFGSEKTGVIYKALKPLLADKKGK